MFSILTSSRSLWQRGWALLVVLALAAGVLAFAHSAGAQNYGLENLYGNVNLGNRPLLSTIGTIINVFLGFLGVIAIGLILYAGFLWMTAQGNEEKIGKAKRILSGAVIGLVIIFAAFSIAAFVIRQISNATNPPGTFVCSDGVTTIPPAASCPIIPGFDRFRVQSVSPARAATNVKLCHRVQGVFDTGYINLLDSSSVDSSTVQVWNTNGTLVTTDDTQVTGSFTFAPKAFSFAHPEFERDRQYRSTIKGGASGVKDTGGRQLSADYNWYFTTGTESDTTLPSVDTVLPSSGAREICRVTPIQVIFSEEMDVTTFTAANIVVTVGGTPVPLGRITPGTDFKSVTIYTKDPLPANADINVLLRSGATGIADACGNQLDGDGDGTPSDYTWTFRTGDTLECAPHLDSITPISGYYGETIVELTGNNLAIVGEVLFNGLEVDTTNNVFPPPPPVTSNLVCWGAAACSTGAIETIRLRVPVGAPIPPNPTMVVVDLLSGVPSNALSFDLQSPYVRSLSPDRGPDGQFITVKGANFGPSPGVVRFRNTITGAYTDTELACGIGSWQETQIVVKVPAGIGVGGYEVQVVTAANKRSNLPDFTVNTDPLAPGLCTVTPSCTQSGVNPQFAELTGVRFGTTQGSSHVQMSVQNESSVGTWGDQRIQSVGFTATYQDATHNVRVVAGGRASNSLDFEIPCSGAPRVVEQQMCASSSQSPSPWRESTDTCGNAIASARFSVPMNPATITFGAGSNIYVQECGNGATIGACTSTLSFGSTQLMRNSQNEVIGFRATPAAGTLRTGYWYKGTILDNLESEAAPPVRLRATYTWNFKVGSALCPVNAVRVDPDYATIRELDPDPLSTQDFLADATALNCNSLDATAYGWAWSFSNNLNSGTPWVELASQNLNQATARAISYMPNRNNPAKLKAEIPLEAKSDTADVYVSATACRASSDCTACGVGVSSCNPFSGTCDPVVTDFSPKSCNGGANAGRACSNVSQCPGGTCEANGAPGTWATINGCYFGNTRGRVLYQNSSPPPALPTIEGLWPNPAICPANTWTTRQIVSEVPPAAADGRITVERPDVPPVLAPSTQLFDVNTTNRPGLCRTQPAYTYESQLGTQAAEVQLRGKDLGDPRGAVDKVQYYDAASTATTDFDSADFALCDGNPLSEPNNCSWSNIAAIVNTPTGTPVGAGLVAVVRNGAASNQMSYTVRPGAPPGSGLPPTVTSVDPPDGIARAGVTSIVTVYGTNLTGGRVYFGGIAAPVTGCMSTLGAITVEVPPLANGNHQVVVKTGVGASTDLVYFDVNSTIRPGICSINPSFGREGTQVVISGRNFTDNRKPSATINSFVSMFCNPADGEAGCLASLNLGPLAGTQPNRFQLGSTYVTSWSTSRIVVKAPPKVRTGDLIVSVDYGDAGGVPRASKPFVFTGLPYITSLAPSTGPHGAWVTIRGGNFGVCPVRGTAVTDACVVTFAANNSSRVLGDSLPTCNNTWTDSEIIAKVPAAAGNNADKMVSVRSEAWPLPIGTLEVPPTSRKPFTVDNNIPLGPGLCAIVPDTVATGTCNGGSNPGAACWVNADCLGSPPFVPNGTCNVSIPLVTLYGDRFGNDPAGANDKVNWPSSTAPAISNGQWSDSSIIVDIPASTISGPVTVQREVTVVTGRTCPGVQVGDTCLAIGGWQNVTEQRLAISNPKQLTVTGSVSTTIPNIVPLSFVPADGAPNICRNAAIAVTFNADIDTNMIPPGTLKLTHPFSCTIASVPARFAKLRHWLRSLVSSAAAALPLCDVPINIRISTDRRTLTIESVTALKADTIHTVTIISPMLADSVGATCDSTGTPCKWSFTTGLEVCTVDRVEITPNPYTFTKFGDSKQFTATALTQDGQVLPANFRWSEDDRDDVVTLRTNGFSTMTVDAGNRNGRANLSAQADVSLSFPTNGRVNPVGAPLACPAGYRWLDHNGNGVIDGGLFAAQECVKREYVASGSASLEVFLCEVPWELKDVEYNFTLKYCRAKVAEVTGSNLAVNGSFDSPLNPAWTWNEDGGAPDWVVSNLGYQDTSSVESRRTWPAWLRQTITGLKPNTTYVAQAYTFVGPYTNNPPPYVNMVATTSTSCAVGTSPIDQVVSAPDWQRLQVPFDTGNNTAYTICLGAVNSTGVAIRFDAVTVQETTNFTPALLKSAELPGSSADIVREYLLKHPSNPDAIALRIYKNDSRLDPRIWYDSRPDIVKGAPQSMVVDGYAGLRDGGTTYVSALDHNGGQLRSYIFVLGLNRGAEGETNGIYQELVNSWAFNTDFGSAGTLKQRMQRDLERLAHRTTIVNSLDSYAKGHGQTIPTIMAGTYIRSRTVSAWDSWQGNLGSELGGTLPKDPLNAFCDVVTNPQCQATACPVGYDQATCWNSVTKDFVCPVGSHVYQYEALSSNKVKLSRNMEVKNVTWCGTAACDRSTPADIFVDNDDSCQSRVDTIDYGNPPLTVVRAGGGAGTVESTNVAGISCGADCTENYAGGTSVVLTATPASGSSVFTGWSGDCTGTGITCTVVVTSNRTVRANFAPVADLSVTVSGPGTVAGPGINCGADCFERYAQGSGVTLTAAAAVGKVFTGWTGACSGASPTCGISMSSNRTVTATFVDGSVVTTTLTGNGTVTSSPAGITCGADCSAVFAMGQPLTLTAVPDAGSVFMSWGGACVASGTNPICTFTPVSATSTVTATFAVGVTITINQAGTGSGTVTSTPAGINCGADCNQTYAANSTVTLTATADADSVFASWSGGGCSGSGTCTLTSITLPDRTITANFTAVNFSLNVTKPGAGVGTVVSNPAGINCGTDCAETYPSGSTVTLLAIAGASSLFQSWTGPCTGGSPSCTVTMDATKTAVANFVTSASATSVTVVKAGAGSGTVVSTAPLGLNCGANCTASFTQGTAVTLQAVANAGSIFAGWSLATCPGVGNCTFTLSNNTTINATFALAYNLTVVRVGSGTVTQSPTGVACGLNCQSYAAGTPVTLTAAPAAGFVFTSWSGGGCSGNAFNCTVTVAAPTNVTATFTAGFLLIVTTSGAGAATSSVASNPAGISCGLDCTQTYATGTLVILTYTQGAGFMFTGWTGSCTGAGPCTVTMSAARTVTATFDNAYLLTVTRASGTGSGTVTATNISEINCGSDCNHTYASGTGVQLTATPNLGSRVASWSGGGCSGAGTTCTVIVTAATTVNVIFELITHAVNVTRAGAGSGQVNSTPLGITCPTDCTENYPEGTPVTLTTTPAGGSIFAGWSGDCTGLSCTLTVNATKNVTATFALARTLSLTISGAGTGSVRSSPAGISCVTGGACPAAAYISGTTVVLTATAQFGSVFQSWSGDCAVYGSNPTCTLSLTANRTASAVFAIAPSYTLNVTTVGSGTVTSFPGGIDCGTTCSASYISGTNVILTAAAGAGHVFGSWTGGVCSGTNPSCTVNMNAAKSVTANFTALVASHTVTVSMTGLGAITSSPPGILCGSSCTASYVDSTNVVLTATALPGYVFDSWGGDCIGTNPTCTFNALSANKTAVANFIVGASYTITVTKSGAGTGTVTSVPAGINCGVSCFASYGSTTSVTLTATPDAGFTFVDWTGDCAGSGTCTPVPGANRTVNARFEPSYLVTVIKSGAGATTSTVTSSPGGVSCGVTCSASFAGGSSVTLTALEAAGYSFSNWSGDVGACTTNPVCVVTINAAKNITANFIAAAVTYTLTITLSGPGASVSTVTGSASPASYVPGTTITLTANLGTNGTFVGFSGGCTSVSGNQCTVIMPASNISVTADFGLTHTYNMANGWNFISLPFNVSNSAWNVLFPTATTLPLKYYGGVYVQATNIEVGYAYFVRFISAQNVTITASSTFSTFSISLPVSWNGSGSLDTSVPISAMTYTPGTFSSLNRFDGPTQVWVSGITQFDPGVGYLGRSSMAGILTITK